MKYLRWIGLAMSLLGIGFVVVPLGAPQCSRRSRQATASVTFESP